MVPSITDVRRALSDCRAALDRLADVRPLDGIPAVCTSVFAEFAVEWHGESWLLCTPLNDRAGLAVEQLSHMAARLKRVGAKHIAEYRVFSSEMRFADSAGVEHHCDVVMQRMPDGITLARAAQVSSHERLLAELDEMQAEFRSIGFTHNNLKPENVIITADEQLVAVRCYFARFGDVGKNPDGESFDAMRRLVMSKPLADDVADRDMEIKTASVAGCEIVGYECEQLIRIRRNGLIGFADAHGEIVIEPQFEEAGDFREGRAEVKKNGLMGLIDKHGRYVLAACYDYLEYRDDCGISLVRSEGVWSAFDYEGNPTGVRHENIGQLLRVLNEKMNITIEI